MNARHILSFDRLIRNGRFAPVLTLSGLLAATLVAAPPTDPGVEAPLAAAADDATLTENPKAPNTDQFDLIFEDAAQQQRVEELIEGLNSAHNASNSARYKYSVRYTDGNRRKLETVLASSEPLAYRKVRKKHPDADSILLVETRKDGDRVDRRRRKPNSGRTIDGPLAGRQGGGNLDQSNQQDRFLAAERRRQRFAELDRAAWQGWRQQWLFADDETKRRMSKQFKATQLAALRGLAAVPSKMRPAVLRMLDRFRYSIIPGTGKTGGQIKAEILRKGGSLIPKDPVSAFTEMIDRMHEQNIQNILRGKTFQDINSRMQQAASPEEVTPAPRRRSAKAILTNVVAETRSTDVVPGTASATASQKAKAASVACRVPRVPRVPRVHWVHRALPAASREYCEARAMRASAREQGFRSRQASRNSPIPKS